jgi:hypothetical protein
MTKRMPAMARISVPVIDRSPFLKSLAERTEPTDDRNHGGP